MNLREKNVITKYFKKNQDQEKKPENQNTDQFGMFIDFYIKQNEGQQYVTKGFGKFEEGLLEHVKKIRNGSIPASI